MKFSVRFLGCKVSQADAMQARDRLVGDGHREVPEGEGDLAIVTTCCVTQEAEAKSRQAVRRALRRGAGEVIATGCAVNRDVAGFAHLDGITALTGTSDEVADRLAAGFSRACADDRDDRLGSIDRRVNPRQPGGGRTRGFVKVQDGCDNGCSYCIIPSVRGLPRSRPAAAVLREVRRHAAAGQVEVVLTGISIGAYADPATGMDIAELLRSAFRVEGVARVRLSSMEVTHLTDALARAIADEPGICSHVHLPLQSGDDRVLAAMGRHYDAKSYLDAVAGLRSVVPGVNVTSDAIVGFPGEDAAAFSRTKEVVRAAGITKVHVFRFSPRPGTAAEALGDPVPAAEKKERARELAALSDESGRAHRLAKIGMVCAVLVDKASASGTSGYTDDYVRVHLPCGAGDLGAIVRVRLTGEASNGLRGEAVQ